MNKPEYLLTHSGPWEINERTHLVFYYNPRLEADINSLIKTHESHFDHITKIIGMSAKAIDSMPKIKVWIFLNDDEKYSKTQINGIHCIYNYFSVYYPAEHCKSTHEYGHILAYYNWGFMRNKNYSLVMDVAFAFYVDEGRAFNFDYKEKTRDVLSNNSYSISNILADKRSFELFTNIGKKQAFVCATFIKYLVEKYGGERFGLLWKEINKYDKDDYKSVY